MAQDSRGKALVALNAVGSSRNAAEVNENVKDPTASCFTPLSHRFLPARTMNGVSPARTFRVGNRIQYSRLVRIFFPFSIHAFFEGSYDCFQNNTGNAIGGETLFVLG